MSDPEEYLTIDINTVCRVCTSLEGVVPVFDDGIQMFGYNLAAMIMSFACVEIAKGDGMPSMLCQHCANKIHKTFQLKALCEHTDANLRRLCTELNDDDKVTSQLGEHLQVEVDLDSENTLEPGENTTTKSHIIDPEVTKLIQDSNKTAYLGSNKSNDKIFQSILIGNDTEDNNNDTEDNNNDADHDNHTDEEEEGLDNEENQDLGSQDANICKICGKGFTDIHLLESHTSMHTGEKPYVCSYCGRAFLRSSNLYEHERRHRRSKSYLCCLCGKLSGRKGDHACPVLNANIDTKVSCNICGKTFASRSSLGTHKKRHESTEKFQCKECSKMYFSNQELQRHMRVHLGVRPYACPEEECTNTFFTQGELNRHLRYHNGERNFCCDICGQKFYESGHLLSHRRKHTGERPYKCGMCPKTYTDRSKLNRHTRTHVTLASSKSMCKQGANEARWAIVNADGAQISVDIESLVNLTPK